MDPGTIAIIGAVGTAIGAAGAIAQGVSANQAAKFNAQVAQNNAVAARQTAAANAARQERLGRKRMGALRVGGASLDLLEDSAMEEELARLSIIHGGEVEAASFTGVAVRERAAGRTALVTGVGKAGATLLIGGAKDVRALRTAKVIT